METRESEMLNLNRFPDSEIGMIKRLTFPLLRGMHVQSNVNAYRSGVESNNLRSRNIRVSRLIFFVIAIMVFVFSPTYVNAATCTSVSSGNWDLIARWDCGHVPVAADTVVIADGHTVTIDTSPTIAGLTVGQGTSGTLTIGNNNGNRTVIVSGDVTVNAGAIFNTAGDGGNLLNISGNLSNAGTFDMRVGAATANTTFNGSVNQSVSGAGATTDFNSIIINNTGAAGSNIVETTSTNFTVPTNFPTLTAGVFKLSSASTITFSAGFTIGSAVGFILNHASASVTLGDGDDSFSVSGGTVTLTAGTFNINGRFGMTGGTTTINGATVNVDPQATVNLSGGSSVFEATGAANITFSSGTVTIVDPHSANGTGNAIQIVAGAGIKTFAGSTFRLGDGTSTTSGSTEGFDVNAGVTIDDVIVNNPSGTNRFVRLMTNNAVLDGTLTVTAGIFDQSTLNLTVHTISIANAGILRNLSTGDLTIGPGGVSNDGTVDYNANGTACGQADSIVIRSSSSPTQRTWTGTGTFSMIDVDVQDQSVSPPPAAILVTSGTNSGNNSGWVFAAACGSGTYTWIGGTPAANTDWQVATNWNPTRTTPAAGDQLIFDGDITPGPTVTNIPTQTIASLDLIDGVAATFNAATVPAGTKTLTISGAAASDFNMPATNSLTIAGSTALVISITGGSTASIGGVMVVQDGAHRLIGNAASVIFFQSGADFTTTTGFTGNAFGSGGGGVNGTTNSVVFQSGSQYFHGAGDSPFGAVGSGPNVVFQTGSEADWLTNSGFQASGRTYANLVIGNSSTEVDVTDSGTGNFQFDNLAINSTGSQDSSLTFTGSGASTVTIKGNITSAGTGIGGTLADLSLTAGSGGIQIDAAGTITFGNIGTSRSIFFGSDATVVSGTTLNLSRLVQMGFTADGIVTDNGAIVPNFLAVPGYIIGAVRKPAVPASYVFPVGKVTGYTPVELSSATGGGDLTVRAVGSQHPAIDPGTSLDEYWTLTLNGGTLTTNLEFTYLESDVDGTEANYRVISIDGSTIVNYPATILNTTDNTAQVNGISGFSDWTLGEPVGPSKVDLTRFNAVSFSDGVQLNWESGFEVDNLGYHVYREKNGQRTRITPSVIAGSALKVGPGRRMTAGYAYSWFDREGTPDATYHLEAIDLNGGSEWAGPIAPYGGVSNKRSSQRSSAKLIDDLSSADGPMNIAQTSWPTAMKSTSAASDSKDSDSMSMKSLDAAGSATVQQAIAAGKAVKIHVRKDGWYRLTQPELVAAGLSALSDARLLQLFVDGQEVPISLSTAGSRLRASDTLEFYGASLDTPTTDTRIYWLVVGNTPGKRMVARRGKLKPFAGDSENYLRNFDVTAERREKLVYFAGLLNGEGENIFGRVVRNQPVTQSISLTHLDPVGSWQPELEIALQGLTTGVHQVNVQLNDVNVGSITFGGQEHPVRRFAVDRSLMLPGDNVVTLTSAAGSDISLVDWIRISYPHQYKAVNNSLKFSAPAGHPVRIDGFTSPNVRVVDITDPNEPNQLSSMAAASGDTYAVSIQTEGSGVRTLIAFTDDLSSHPAAIKPNQPSTWKDANNGADMLIITHKNFRSAVTPLANLRTSQGMSVAVVDVEDIYDEFSYGAHTPLALKSFLAEARTNWQRKPQYLLLVGDSTWDPRNYLDSGDNDFVPTKLIDTEHSETVSDDWLADFSNSGIADLAIGRLPARTSTEAALMVSKILKYEQERELNAPLRGAVLVADNGFEARNAQTSNLLPSDIAITNINRAQIGNDDIMRGQIVTALNEGPMLVNYYGHGSVNVWTGAGLLDNDLALSLTNVNRPSVYVMMTCLNGYASDAFVDSLAESSIKAQKGGAAAVWASSGFTEPFSQFAMNSEFYRLLFGGQPIRLGEATRAAKAATNNLDVRRTWILLGDPAMRIR